MAGIVDALVSIPGYVAVRYSFRISSFLRSCRLPSFLFIFPVVQDVRSGRSAMCGRVDVDLCYRRVLDCRGGFRSTLTFPTSVGRVVDFAARVGTPRNAAGFAADGGCLSGRRVHSYPATRTFRVAKRGSYAVHALRLLGTHEA